MATPEFYIEHDFHDDVVRFRGEFPMRALTTLRLDPVERALLLGPTSNAPADYLLVLEMLFRRYAEQHTRPGTRSASTDAPAPQPAPLPALASLDAPRG